jgi:hypothetical protein
MVALADRWRACVADHVSGVAKVHEAHGGHPAVQPKPALAGENHRPALCCLTATAGP